MYLHDSSMSQIEPGVSSSLVLKSHTVIPETARQKGRHLRAPRCGARTRSGSPSREPKSSGRGRSLRKLGEYSWQLTDRGRLRLKNVGNILGGVGRIRRRLRRAFISDPRIGRQA
jgi:hypothetical protein